jgi:histidinol-phosphatase (PHP family)
MNNYHTHTYRCQHASGDVGDYAARALKGGAHILGMSDHTPLPDRRWDWVRMAPEDLPGYIASIDKAREAFPDLRILKGLEAEYDGPYVDYYREIRETWSLDYLVGAIHWVPFRGNWIYLSEVDSAAKMRAYVDYAAATMESGLFTFLAHPDGFGAGYLKWDDNCQAASRDILTAALEFSVPLEINGLGFRKKPVKFFGGERQPYPLGEFWDLAAEYPVQVVTNSDAHDPEHVLASLDITSRWAGERGLTLTDLFVSPEVE